MMNNSLFMNDPETNFDEKRATSLVFGCLLVTSVFLPWFSVSSFGMDFSISGVGFNEILGLVAVLSGVAAVVGSFLREDKVSGLVSVAAGAGTVLAFFLLIFSYPKLSLQEGPFSGMSLSIIDVIKDTATAGFYFYFILAAGLIMSGILGLVIDFDRT